MQTRPNITVRLKNDRGFDADSINIVRHDGCWALAFACSGGLEVHPADQVASLTWSEDGASWCARCDGAVPQFLPIQITINGRPHRGEGKARLAYGELMELLGHKPDRVISVVWSRGPAEKPEGSLAPGESVRLVAGMRIEAYDTSAA